MKLYEKLTVFVFVVSVVMFTDTMHLDLEEGEVQVIVRCSGGSGNTYGGPTGSAPECTQTVLTNDIIETKCPSDARYQSSFDHLNFNTISRDYFCSWMHSTPFNIPDEYRYSGDLKTDSMGVCAVPDADTCFTGIKSAKSRCAMPQEPGTVLIVPKPQTVHATDIIARATYLHAPSFNDPKAIYLKMDELFKFRSSEMAFLLDGVGNLKGIEISEYASTAPICESCQNGANCLSSQYAWFEPKGDTTKKDVHHRTGTKCQSEQGTKI